jgi:hypothetical protein
MPNDKNEKNKTKKLIFYIDDYIKRNYKTPSLRDICNATGISSTSQAKKAIEKGIKNGDFVKIKLGWTRAWFKDLIDNHQVM